MGVISLLAVVVEEAVILGAMSEFENFNSKTFCSITKTVFIFHRSSNRNRMILFL